jgi:hypothetical protein
MITLAALGTLAAAPALAQVAAPAVAPPTDQKAAKKNDRNKVICKTDEYVGSRIPSRICKTASEWEVTRQDAQTRLNQAGRSTDRQLFAPLPVSH